MQDVTPASPGARAGLRTYDVIIAVDGEPIDGNDTLVRLIAARQPGSTATVQVMRDGRPLSVALKLAERPQRDRRVASDRIGRPTSAEHCSACRSESSTNGHPRGLVFRRAPAALSSLAWNP